MIYISGKITNEDKAIQKMNMVRFFEVEKEFKEKGIETFNPARVEWENPELDTYDKCMAHDLIFIIENKPEMYMMLGWEDSKGANLELEVARQLKLKIAYESDNTRSGG